ncbi:mitochondrial ribosomal subunit S27-domain-containing protein [Jimgerdemannia flammicorona]|uniref:Small ribosomal subunit protein mS33 n=1 Tax=Jimgerdemannia flammicorona TaxID=994334 RepID=A0A433QR25_9FUNG|nr:mitochondrial ribosomal subunit S27-domain-containing protein [Jimgerdemannia flammicorona]
MAATAVPSATLQRLAQLSCKLFNNLYNPTNARTGNKVLRGRLLGPALTSYYPQKLLHFRDVKAAYPNLGLVDLEEKERLDEIARRKRRGKGTPKKGMFLVTGGRVSWGV